MRNSLLRLVGLLVLCLVMFGGLTANAEDPGSGCFASCAPFTKLCKSECLCEGSSECCASACGNCCDMSSDENN